MKYLKFFCHLTPFANFVMFCKAYNSSLKWRDESIKKWACLNKIMHSQTLTEQSIIV